jgi:ABC-2 type transport system ATP-binding protein
MTPTVDLADVVHRYGSTTALDRVTLRLETGVTGLLGPNGAGKSTLMRVLATVINPDAGTVRLLGRDTADADQRTQVRRQLGYLPQELGFPRGFTAFGFVDYLALLKEFDDRPARQAEVRRALDLVGLRDVATTRVRRLSGGMRRRLGLAQALLGDPRLLVLDEPSTGLDPEQRAVLRTLLSRAAGHATVVVSTHQTEDVAALCDRVVVLDSGQVAFDGSVADLVDHAAGRVWVAEHPDPDAAAQWRTGTGLHRNLGTPPPGAHLVEPTLEDAYLLLRNDTARATP